MTTVTTCEFLGGPIDGMIRAVDDTDLQVYIAKPVYPAGSFKLIDTEDPDTFDIPTIRYDRLDENHFIYGELQGDYRAGT